MISTQAYHGGAAAGHSKCLPDKRRAERLQTGQAVLIHYRVGRHLANALNLSAGGIALALREGRVPMPGEPLILTLAGGVSLRATCVWEGGTLVGCSYETPLIDAERLIDVEMNGANYFRDLAMMRQLYLRRSN